MPLKTSLISPKDDPVMPACGRSKRVLLSSEKLALYSLGAFDGD